MYFSKNIEWSVLASKPGWDEIFPTRQTRNGAHTTSCRKGTGSLSLPGLNRPVFVFNHPNFSSANIKERVRFITLLHFWVCMASYTMKFDCKIVQFSIALLKIIFISLNFVNNLIVQNITLMSVSSIISRKINLNAVRIWIWSPPKVPYVLHTCNPLL
jgi:hypothetical protein